MEKEAGVIFYVSTQGNDAWTGKLAEAKGDRSDGPFATLQKARDAVRGLKEKESGLTIPVTVIIRGGTYFLSKTLALSDKDSGTRECPVTWQAYPGETPILSGGQVISNWKPYKGDIQQADCPAALIKQAPVRQLFYRGQRQRRSRWPKYDPENPIRGGWAFPEGPVEEYPMQAFRFKADAFPRKWAKPQEGEVKIYAGFVGWSANLIPLRSIDYEEQIVWLAHRPLEIDYPPWFMQYTLNENSRYIVENILEELSEPGEWCCDTGEGKLYFWPPEEGIGDGDVILPALDCLIDLRDTEWITLRGLTFSHTTTGDETHRNREDGLGAMFPQQGWKYCGEALHMRGTTFCAIQDCYFDQVGGNAIYIERSNLRNTIQNNEIAYAGANGIVLVGDRAFHPLFNQVVDNHIHHAGRILN
ncbi:MAG: right-handed parallel beta-helix repeat-containing protein, partial [Omnitrophica WOR_2 bacterium]